MTVERRPPPPNGRPWESWHSGACRGDAGPLDLQIATAKVAPKILAEQAEMDYLLEDLRSVNTRSAEVLTEAAALRASTAAIRQETAAVLASTAAIRQETTALLTAHTRQRLKHDALLKNVTEILERPLSTSSLSRSEWIAVALALSAITVGTITLLRNQSHLKRIT